MEIKYRSYCVCCGSKKYHKYLYFIKLPFIGNTIKVCTVCYVIYKDTITVVKPGMSTPEDIDNLKWESKKNNKNE